MLYEWQAWFGRWRADLCGKWISTSNDMGGTVNVLSIFSHKAATKAAPRDWSQQEIGEFYRAHSLLRQHGVNIGIDRGVTDSGDPWLVYFDERSDEVFMHIARLDGKCVMICEHLGVHLQAADIPSLMATFESQVASHFNFGAAERKSKVILHPAARIIFSITAVFLLSKLDTTEAHAKSADGSTKADAEPWNQRKMDATLAQRLQSFLSSLHEMMDNPVAAAAIASILLLQDGALQSLLTGREILRGEAKHEVATVSHPSDETHTQVATEPLKTDEKIQDERGHVDKSAAAVHVAAEEKLASVKIAGPHSQPTAEVAKTAAPAPANDLQVEQVERAPATDAQASLVASNLSGVINDSADSGLLSFQTLKEVFGSSFVLTADAVSLQTGAAIFASVLIGGGDDSFGSSIVIPSDTDTAVIAAVSPAVTSPVVATGPAEFFTSFGSAISARVLSYFTEHMSSVIVQAEGVRGFVMFDTAVANTPGAQIGIWTNTYDDGSVIKVIGLASMIDDYVMFQGA